MKDHARMARWFMRQARYRRGVRCYEAFNDELADADTVCAVYHMIKWLVAPDTRDDECGRCTPTPG